MPEATPGSRAHQGYSVPPVRADTVRPARRRRAIVALTGYAGAGKDALAAALVADHGYVRVAFADPLKELARRIGWDGVKDDAGRELLQNLGVAVRDVIHRDVWLTLALDTIDALPPGQPVVVTDVRFVNEIEALRDRGALLVRIRRPGVGPANDHVSEAEWTTVAPDGWVDNVGDLDELARAAWMLTRLVGYSSSATQPANSTGSTSTSGRPQRTQTTP